MLDPGFCDLRRMGEIHFDEGVGRDRERPPTKTVASLRLNPFGPSNLTFATTSNGAYFAFSHLFFTTRHSFMPLIA